MAGTCSLLFVCLCRKWVAAKLGDGIIVATIVSAAFAIGGTIGTLINSYDMYMASKFPLMWVIANKVM